MSLPTTATGRTGTVTFDGHTITIRRKGPLAILAAGPGEKRIPLENVTALQFKPARLGSSGYIQFTIDGVERRPRLASSVSDALNGENSLVFWDSQQAQFEALRDAVQEAQRRLPSGGADPADLADQLGRLAQLRKAGALTSEEFAAAKARLLG